MFKRFRQTCLALGSLHLQKVRGLGRDHRRNKITLFSLPQDHDISHARTPSLPLLKMMLHLISSHRAVAIIASSLRGASESPTQHFLSLHLLATQKEVFLLVSDAHLAFEATSRRSAATSLPRSFWRFVGSSLFLQVCGCCSQGLFHCKMNSCICKLFVSSPISWPCLWCVESGERHS